MTGSLGKVLLIVENLSVPFDRRVWREALSLHEAGYQVSVISPKGEDRDRESHTVIGGIHVYRFRLIEAEGGLLSYALEYGHALMMIQLLAFRIWLRHGIGVIQICNPPDLLFLAVLPFKLLRKKLVFDHHDLAPEVWLAKKGLEADAEKPGFVHKVLCLLERLTFRFADVVMSTNESYRQVAIERGGVDESRVFVVRNGLELKNIADVIPNPALREGQPILIVYVGMMGAQDGVDYLLRAIAHLHHQLGQSGFHVRLMGDGPALESLRCLAGELGVASFLTFTGLVTHEDCLEGTATADICVCPDPKIGLNDCSTLVKVMEYMSLGKPTVAFDLKETRFSAGEAALYATPNDETELAAHIHTLMDRPELRAKLGECGKRRVIEGLSWDHSKEHLLAAYRMALGESAEPQ